MARSTLSLVIRCCLPLAGLCLADCVVTTNSAVPARQGTITVQGNAPPTGYVATQTVQQPVAYNTAPQPVVGYNAAPPPVVGYNASAQFAAPAPVVGTPVMGASIGGYVGVPVSGNWVTTGYDQADYVSFNMSLRARQFAAGFYPVTQLFRAQMYQGAHQFVTVQAQAGRCYRVVGVGGPGVQDLDLRLRDMSGNVIDQDVATDNFPVLGLQRPLCLQYNGTFQVEVIMYAGGGQIGVQAFAQ